MIDFLRHIETSSNIQLVLIDKKLEMDNGNIDHPLLKDLRNLALFMKNQCRITNGKLFPTVPQTKSTTVEVNGGNECQTVTQKSGNGDSSFDRLLGKIFSPTTKDRLVSMKVETHTFKQSNEQNPKSELSFDNFMSPILRSSSKYGHSHEAEISIDTPIIMFEMLSPNQSISMPNIADTSRVEFSSPCRGEMEDIAHLLSTPMSGWRSPINSKEQVVHFPDPSFTIPINQIKQPIMVASFTPQNLNHNIAHDNNSKSNANIGNIYSSPEGISLLNKPNSETSSDQNQVTPSMGATTHSITYFETPKELLSFESEIQSSSKPHTPHPVPSRNNTTSSNSSSSSSSSEKRDPLRGSSPPVAKSHSRLNPHPSNNLSFNKRMTKRMDQAPSSLNPNKLDLRKVKDFITKNWIV